MFFVVIAIGFILWLYFDKQEDNKKNEQYLLRNAEYDKQLYDYCKGIGLTEEEMNKKGFLYDFKIQRLRDYGMIK